MYCHGFKDTCELIESLQTHVHSVSYEIIVVDNASREDEAAKIKELYSDIVTLRSESNLGFSGGNNLGIRVAKGAYIFLINNDTSVSYTHLSASPGYQFCTVLYFTSARSCTTISTMAACNWFSSRIGAVHPLSLIHISEQQASILLKAIR